MKTLSIKYLVLSFVYGQIHAQTLSEWSVCSKLCGGGTQTRNRCIGNFCYPSVSVYCNNQPCAPSTWGTYTPCSKSCGGGHRFKVEACIRGHVDLCRKIYEVCNTQLCPSNARCYGDVRFETISQCCHDTKETCGIPKPNPHIDHRLLAIGGKESELEDWPWAAAIVYKTKKTTHCSGSLIHKDWVLSAAHCMKSSHYSWYDKDKLYVMLGSTSIKHPDASQQIIEIEKFVPHESFKNPNHDIGLIRLKKPAIINKYVNTICLPNKEDMEIDTKCVAIGWGVARRQDVATSKASDKLHHVQLSHLPKDACVNGLTGLSYLISQYSTRQNLCFGHLPGGKDTCIGDSGGPIMCQRASSCGWFVAGTTAYGANQQCAEKGQPAVYMHVKNYEPWIKRTIG